MTDYCTESDVKNGMSRAVAFSAIESAVVAQLIAEASELINNTCNRPDGFVALAVGTARLFAGSGARYQRIDECVAVSKVEVKTSTTSSTYDEWTTDDYSLARGSSKRPDFNRTPYDLLLIAPGGSYSRFTSGKSGSPAGFRPDQDYVAVGAPTLRVTARWGYAATCPTTVRRACVIQVAKWFKRGEGAYGDSLQNNETGTVFYTKSLDPDVKRLLEDGRLVRESI